MDESRVRGVCVLSVYRWSKVKLMLRRWEKWADAQPVEAIWAAMGTVTPRDMLGYFAHANADVSHLRAPPRKDLGSLVTAVVAALPFISGAHSAFQCGRILG